jgi:adenylate kinase
VRIVLLGPPGSGKGTQGARLAEYYQVPHIATGDIIRDQIARKTSFGQKVQAAIAAGNFAPDGDILKAVSERTAEADAQTGCILDGFPRDILQARIYDELLAEQGEQLDAVVEFVVSEAELIQRLSGREVCPTCGAVYHLEQCPPKAAGICDFDQTPLVIRPDDRPDAIKHRFEVYRTETLPLTDYYAKQHKLVTVNASGDVNQITEDIIRAIDGLKRSHF